MPGGSGAPGTVAAITAALCGTGLPTCGYNGLMLPVLEDPVLAREWERGTLGAHQLLAYPAICGTGKASGDRAEFGSPYLVDIRLPCAARGREPAPRSSVDDGSPA